jgi:hypothetical protein
MGLGCRGWYAKIHALPSVVADCELVEGVDSAR